MSPRFRSLPPWRLGGRIVGLAAPSEPSPAVQVGMSQKRLRIDGPANVVRVELLAGEQLEEWWQTARRSAVGREVDDPLPAVEDEAATVAAEPNRIALHLHVHSPQKFADAAVPDADDTTVIYGVDPPA